MRTHAIRHLPVLDAGKLVGVLSDRDVQRFRRYYDPDLDVEDAMTEDVYKVVRDEPLDRVVAAMAERKAGSNAGPLASVPTVKVAGHTAHELATPLATILEWQAAGVSTIVGGSVTPAAAETAAADLG